MAATTKFGAKMLKVS